jgi:hypothetical protein
MQGAYPAVLLVPFTITQEKWDEFSNIPLSDENIHGSRFSACFLNPEEDPLSVQPSAMV